MKITKFKEIVIGLIGAYNALEQSPIIGFDKQQLFDILELGNTLSFLSFSKDVSKCASRYTIFLTSILAFLRRVINMVVFPLMEMIGGVDTPFFDGSGSFKGSGVNDKFEIIVNLFFLELLDVGTSLFRQFTMR
jgi:hypothetical protein